MTFSQTHDLLKQSGAQTIASAQATGAPIPLEFSGVVFRQMFEYAVLDFEPEVGFYSEAFGFVPVANSSDYALFTNSGHDFFLSFRHAESNQVTPTRDLKLLFMTGNIDSAESHLRHSGLISGIKVRNGSPTQRVVYLNSPAGLPIEIWEDPRPRE